MSEREVAAAERLRRDRAREPVYREYGCTNYRAYFADLHAIADAYLSIEQWAEVQLATFTAIRDAQMAVQNYEAAMVARQVMTAFYDLKNGNIALKPNGQEAGK